jgi:uncharacterized membrane protein YebE (DUF533 family)
MTATDTDHHHPEELEADDQTAADARRLAQWVIVAGLVLGVAAAAFLVWEAWSANRAALEHNRRAEEADVIPFDGRGDPAPPAASAPAGPGRQEG